LGVCSTAETIESACLAAAAGGYGTVVCMANTVPVTDTLSQAISVKDRCNALGLVDVYPALSLSKGMEGRELTEYPDKPGIIRLLSEDGKDIIDDGLFLAAMKESCRTGIPVSCHCDLGGENSATKRAIELGKKAGCHLHIAHISTKEAAAMIREAKKDNTDITCEVTPHHIALTKETAAALGQESYGRVNPPLRSEEDREALIAAIVDGTIDAIATDHAPHTQADKKKGSPGFSGLETAFAVCYSTLVLPGFINLSKLSSLMSAAPARLLGLCGSGSLDNKSQGLLASGKRADFAIIDLNETWTVKPAAFFSRGKNSPFAGLELSGKIKMTIAGGRIVFDQNNYLKP
jgi:dihydroorotase